VFQKKKINVCSDRIEIDKIQLYIHNILFVYGGLREHEHKINIKADSSGDVIMHASEKIADST
jgi:hypothetical protein